MPKHAPCCTVSLFAARRRSTMNVDASPQCGRPQCINPIAYNAPPNVYGLGAGSNCDNNCFESSARPRWMTPTPAVAENLAQFVALDNQSKFCLKNVSLVVPQLLMAFANTTEPCMTEFLPSTDFFNFLQVCHFCVIFE